MRVLIAEKFEKSGVERIQSLGCVVTYNPDIAPDDLPGLVSTENPDVLIVRGKKVRAAVFETADKLSLVIRAGAGYDSIDVAAASARGIFVANCPGKNAIAVAELTWGLILACDRRIPDQTSDLRNGTWNKTEYSKARGLAGRTLGLIGLGTIAQEVADRARAFGMDVIAWSRSLNDARARAAGVTACPNPITVAQHADVISVNVAANADTKHLINDAFCEAMRPGTIFINTSRGSVVDENALLKAVREKGVRAGLDVYENEPGGKETTFESVLAREPGVVGTHHIGASTDQAQNAIADEAVRIVSVYKSTGTALNVVNRCEKSPATRLLSVRHRNRPGVLAHVIGEIGKAEINIEEMENIIYQGAEAACARIRLDAEPSPETIAAIADSSRHVLSVDLTAI